MPRLPPSLLQKLTRTHSPLLPIILRETRDVRSAENELRWMREHIEKLVPNTGEAVQRKRDRLLRRFCMRRGVWAEPLQYILGNEYFGPSGVEIRVERGVLVPRPETADLIAHFTSLLLSNSHSPFLSPLRQIQPKTRNQRPLRILDLCTGSGCIPILLHSLLYPPGGKIWGTHASISLPPKILGVDISPKAISLARRNLRHNLNPEVGSLDVSAAGGGGGGVRFVQGDVFDLTSWAESASQFFSTTTDPGEELEVDIVISNPPYISPRDYCTTTARSVRRWEPKNALVPPVTTTSAPALGDDFYPHIVRLALDIRAKALLVEVGGDEGQAERVRGMFASIWGGRGNTAVWRDWGGRGRGVVAWRGGGEGWGWLGEDVVKD